MFTDEDMDGFQSLGLNAVTKEEAMVSTSPLNGAFIF